MSAEDSEYEVSSSDEELQNATLDKRILESRARGRPVSKLKGKNGFVWDMKAPERRSDRFSDVSPEFVFGPADAAANLEKIEEFWDILFNNEIINIIVEHTNEKIEDVCARILGEERNLENYHHHTDVTEIRAFIGILYYAGLWKSSGVDDHRLWDKKNGMTMYRCVMPKRRFSFLASCLRFDNKETRNKADRFAPIRNIWEIFIANCKRYYTPSNKCTVDEQLLSFRGRCSFRMYMKSKPDKYGLKIITLNDAETSYLINGIPYLGKTSVRVRDEPISQYFFRKVTIPIHGTGRTVTCDNWFTSIPLIQRMLEPAYNLTITGTIRKNKREVPAEMKVASKDPPQTKLCFARDITLLSYSPKKNKIVLIASSYSHSTDITDSKPNTILHYNYTKGGTDCFDQLCHSYTVTKRTTRWPMRIFFGMLDQAIVNARILLKCKNMRAENRNKVTAVACLEQICSYLVTPHLKERYAQPTLRKDIRYGIAAIINKDRLSEERKERIVLEKRCRCALCDRKKDNKTKETCQACERPICQEHRVYLCVDCYDLE